MLTSDDLTPLMKGRPSRIWLCDCGYQNATETCSKCGKPKPDALRKASPVPIGGPPRTIEPIGGKR